MTTTIECPGEDCEATFSFPLSPEQLHEHRDHILEDEDGERVRINFNRSGKPDGARTVGVDF